MKNVENADTELLIYATTLVNKTLCGISDQDSFYDECDSLELQGMEGIIQHYLSRTGTDLDLLDQFQLYEAALRFEDGETNEVIGLSDDTLKKPFRRRSSNSIERRKSKRQMTTLPAPPPPPIPSYQIIPPAVPPLPVNYLHQQSTENDSSSSGGDLNGFDDCKVREGGAGVTPGLRRRRQKSFQRGHDLVANDIRPVESDENGKFLLFFITKLHSHCLCNLSFY